MTTRFRTIEMNDIRCAVVESDGVVITDVQSAVDLLMGAAYGTGTKNIIIDKRLIDEDFFILSTGLAGEILQKFVDYGGRIAVYGDYSRYASKPLADFIRENDKGRNVFFVPTEKEAVVMLTQ